MSERPLPSFPFRIEFEVTGLCNIDCKYCYARPLSSLTPTVDQLCFLFNKTKEEADPFEVIILGGEPFIRKDIISILELAQGIFKIQKIGVSTNGTLIHKLTTDDLTRLKTLSERGLSFQITLDSTNPEIHDILRGKGKDTLAGLNTFEKEDIPFVIGMCLTSHNYSDITNSITQLLTDYSQLSHINLMPLQPFSPSDKTYSSYCLASEQMRKIRNEVADIILDAGRSDVTISGVTDCGEAIDALPLINTYNFKTCLAGLTRAGVYPDGSVSPCTTMRNHSLGNLYNESWKEIWTRARKRFENLDITGSQCHALST
ncbi:radical SAM protein [Methanolobus sediminis]|uniref:Radical SAM protein n=1 Tax=Methanolobus sediminis TaxID=3072978 RepID=A0AA51YI40_9EURY|nr:radical SAM protein [Methanolobus sediminis]WMW24116.1 radical SAM protein [Methanolobus sediminis]